MELSYLEIENVRNLEKTAIFPSPQINILFGENASGKTSLLESIHLLSSGKSFRTHRLSNLLKMGGETLRVTGKVQGHDGHHAVLGIEHKMGKSRIKAKGQSLRKASELAAYLPLIAIHQDSHRVFNGGPKERRQFIDWGVFHVEHRFLSLWHRYNRVLKQRNKMLQQRAGTINHSWDSELKSTAEQIHSMRKGYIKHFLSVFSDYCEIFLKSSSTIEVEYFPGWQTEIDYMQVLARSFELDKRRGYTQKGPHRADILFKIQGVPAQDHVSRGQQKLLVCAMHIAHARVIRKLTGKTCVIMVDDLIAELDDRHINNLIRELGTLSAQVFLTTTDREKLDSLSPGPKKVFHVEHGRIQEMV